MAMFPDVRELDPAAVWRSGSLPRWASWLIACGCAVTVALAAVGARLMWQQDGWHSHVDRFWFCNGLALLLGFWIAMTFLPRWRLARLLRVGVLLPIAHALALAVAWRMWAVASPRMHELLDMTPMVRALPIGPLLAGLAIICVVASWLIARRRSREWPHAATTLALAHLLLLGLWLPIAATGLGHRVSWEIDGAVLHGIEDIIAFALVPPLVGAIAYTALAIRRPEWLAQHQVSVRAIGCVLFVVAIVARLGKPGNRNVIYANFTHVLLAAGAVAIGALAALVVTNAHRAARRRGRIEGVVAGAPGEVFAVFQISGWLRGPRSVVRSFVVRTSSGDVPVPGDIELIAPVPAATTELAIGEATAVLRTGDRVVLAGFVSPDGGQPFRDSLVPVPGAQGVAVAVADAPRPDLAELALIAWRPCVAYLLILLGVALPALAGALGA